MQHCVYFSQLSAHKKGLDAARPPGHWLAALKQADKKRPLQTFLSPFMLLLRWLAGWLAKNKTLLGAATASRVTSEDDGPAGLVNER